MKLLFLKINKYLERIVRFCYICPVLLTFLSLGFPSFAPIVLRLTLGSVSRMNAFYLDIRGLIVIAFIYIIFQRLRLKFVHTSLYVGGVERC